MSAARRPCVDCIYRVLAEIARKRQGPAIGESSGTGCWESAGDPTGLQAGGAHVEALRGAGHHGPYPLDVGVPASLGPLLGPRHVVAEARSLPADITHGCHWSSLP